MRFLVFLLSICFPPYLAAWSAQGHRIVGQIAEAQLTPAAKKQINQLLQIPLNGYPLYGRDFVGASTWADQIRKSRISESKKFKSWHFIDIPFSTDSNIKLPKIRSENLVQALNKTRSILENPQAPDSEKALALRFFIHLVADAHQPLHCATQVTSQHPRGDHGGNDFPIHTAYADNLHGLWDAGVGLFKIRKPWARQIEADYPRSKYMNLIIENNPGVWVKECHEIARTIAYNIGEGDIPSSAYIQKGQQVTEEQLAIAGYRLAYQLNNLFR
jgi:hypothetical protein